MGTQSAHFYRCPTDPDVLQRRLTSGHLHGMWHASDGSEPKSECHCPGRLQLDPMRTECRPGLQALIDAIGVGWCFTIYAIIGALCIPIFVLLRTHGMQWRTGSRFPHGCAARREESSQDPRLRGTISGK